MSGTEKRLRRIDRLTLLVAWALAAAQTPGFEVPSVKAAPPGEALTVLGTHGGPGTADPGRWWADNLTLANLMLYGYDIRPYQLSGPAWMNEAHYRTQATLPPGASRDDLRLMVRVLLEERFHVKSHRETREIAVLTLVVGKNGPNSRSRQTTRRTPGSSESRARRTDASIGGASAARWRCSL
jgi:uncharacterized protein (TIGR03435 family)